MPGSTPSAALGSYSPVTARPMRPLRVRVTTPSGRCPLLPSVGQKLMNKFLVVALALVVAAGIPAVASAATDPADTYPELHLIPWPKKLQAGAGHMQLTAGSRIVAGEEQLEPLAEVLAAEIALVT